MRTVNEHVNARLTGLRKRGISETLKPCAEERRISRGAENFSLLDEYFVSYFGNLWKMQFSGSEYEAAGREALWIDSLEDFSYETVKSALQAMNRGEVVSERALPLPGEFAAFCKKHKPAYYGASLVNAEVVKQLPRLSNKSVAANALAEIKAKLGVKR